MPLRASDNLIGARVLRSKSNRLADFLKDKEQVRKFKESIRRIEFNAIVRPGSHSSSYRKEYLEKTAGRLFPYPFLDHDFHIKCIADHVERAVSGEIVLHPVLAYSSLFDLRSSYAPASKSKAKGKKKTSRAAARTRGKSGDALRKKRFLAVQKIMSRLRVPAYMKRAKTEFEIKESSVRAFEDMYGEFLNLRLRIQTLENEVLAYQNPDYAHPPIKAKLQEFQTQNNDLAMRFVKEQNRADILESEIQRLTDHILAQPAEGELDALKREYNVLSQKCDNLVSRNIELSNRMKELGRSKQLEDILDGIRDKINSALRAGIHEAPDAILKSLSDEISQLKRARLYLGRALYDIGILYHRKGDRERAKEELRAARELGVRDAEVENILKQN